MMRRVQIWTILTIVAALVWQPGAGVVSAAAPASSAPTGSAPAGCQLAEPFVSFADALGPDVVGACVSDATTDADGLLQVATDGEFRLFAGANLPVFTDGLKVWLDGPGGIGSDVRVVIPESKLGPRIEARRPAAFVFQRGAIDESNMPMTWMYGRPPTGRTYPSTNSCAPSSEELALGKQYTMYQMERRPVRMLQTVTALRDGGGPELFAQIRERFAMCPESTATTESMTMISRVTVHPFQTFGEETIRYTTVSTLSNAPQPQTSEVVVSRYGDLVIMHAYLADDPSTLELEYLPLMLEVAEAKLRHGLR